MADDGNEIELEEEEEEEEELDVDVAYEGKEDDSAVRPEVRLPRQAEAKQDEEETGTTSSFRGVNEEEEEEEEEEAGDEGEGYDDANDKEDLEKAEADMAVDGGRTTLDDAAPEQSGSVLLFRRKEFDSLDHSSAAGFEDVLYGSTDPGSLYLTSEMLPFEFGVQLPAVDPDRPKVAESERAAAIVAALTAEFGVDGVRMHVRGAIDTRHAFIKVGAGLEQLFQWAEEARTEVRSAPWRGGGYRAYTRADHALGAFKHVGCAHRHEEDCDCCRHPGECDCMVLVPYQRQQLVRGHIAAAFDRLYRRHHGGGLLAAEEAGDIVSVFPLHTLHHDESLFDSYPSRRTIIERYASWGSTLGAVMVPSRSNRFVNLMRDYFGEQLGLYYAFLHFLTRWLAGLALFGGALFAMQVYDESDARGVPVYAVVVSVWSVSFIKAWRRRQATLASEWNTDKFEDEDMRAFVKRASRQDGGAGAEKSFGFYERHSAWVDMSAWLHDYAEPRYGTEVREFVSTGHRDHSGLCPHACCCCCTRETNTRALRVLRSMLAWGVVLTALATALAVSLSILYFRLFARDELLGSPWGSLAAGSLQAVAVVLLDGAFAGLAVRLCEWENWRTRTEYEDSLIAKQFTFQFCNAFFSLYYIAFYKSDVFRDGDDPPRNLFGRRDACLNASGDETSSCMTELTFQLATMMVTRMIIGNVAEWFFPYVQLKLRVWRRRRVAQRELAASTEMQYATKEELAAAMADRAAWLRQVDATERQALMPRYGGGDVFDEYSELLVSFGYVTLFAPAFSLAPVLAVISNLIEHRNDARKVLNLCQRPDYRGAQDIGTWMVVLRFLALAAVITNMGIIAFTSSQLDSILGDEPSNFTKLWLVVIAEHIIFSLQFFVENAVNDRPSRVRVGLAREQEILRVEHAFAEAKEKQAAAAAAGPAKLSRQFTFDPRRQYTR